MRKKVPLLSVIFLMLFSTGLYAQISLNVKNKTVKEVLREIEKTNDFNFFYSENLKDLDKQVSLQISGESLEKTLNLLLSGTEIAFQKQGSNIVLLFPKGAGKIEQAGGPARKYTGTVRDNAGEPIIGANILEKGTSNGTVSDTDGKFVLTVPSGSILLVSSIGYISQEILVGNQTTIDIQMKEDTYMLNEIVTIGYGSVKRSNLTGAVSSLKMEETPMVATTSVANLLTGRMPGLLITQSSASPYGGYEVLIRGAASTGAGNSPLYVIDGFPGGDINTISPNDIESIEVLKDASATAIYGARAANGVILVNTKKGKVGKLKVDLQLNTSFQTIANPYKFLGAKDYMQLVNTFYNEEWLYNNKIAPYGTTNPATVTSRPVVAFSDQQINTAYDVTDWFDEISRTGIIDNESLSLSGGSEQATYTLSFGHFKQKGVVIMSGLEKFMGRISMDFKLSKWLTTGANVSTSQQNTDVIEAPQAPANPLGIIRLTMGFPSYLPVKDDKGNYLLNPDHPVLPNPVSYKEVTDTEVNNRFLITNYWNAKITNDLVFRGSWGVTQSFYRHNQYYPKSTLLGSTLNSQAKIWENRNHNYLLDATLTYNRQLFNNHHLTAMLGYAYQKFISEGVYASNTDFLTDVFNVYNLAGGGSATQVVGSSKNVTKFLSYFGRLNYDIAEKYLFTLTVRADGSDRFGANNRYGYFPSGAFAWRVSEEDFMKSQRTLSSLKLRVSIGQTGNSEIGGNAYGYYSTGSNYVVGNKLQTGIYESQLVSPNLKWETTMEYNLGIDYGFLNNRISGSLEFFRKTISDLLDRRNVGSYYPVNTVADNLGSTIGQGWEAQVTSINIRNKQFSWKTDLNLAHFYDRWKERNPFTILSVYQTSTDPLHVGWGYLSDGLIKPGDDISHMQGAIVGNVKLKDISGWLKDEKGNYVLDANGRQQLSGSPDGIIDDADKVIITHDYPKLNFGINNTLQYKNFDFSFFFYGEIGRTKQNTTLSNYLGTGYTSRENMPVEANNIWRHDNPDGKYPFTVVDKFGPGDFWVEKADFIRLKNITLGYNLPKKIFGQALSNARIFLDAQNLFVITGYSGTDPETDSFAAYPNQRTYSIGININF